MKLTGVITFVDLEGGVWLFKSDDGKTYQLAGGDRHIKKDGSRAEVEGTVEDRPSLAMAGPILKVSSYRFL